MRHQVRIGDQYLRRIPVTLEDDHGFSRLHKKRFILLQVFERFKNGVERFPGTGGFSTPTVDNEVFRLLGYFGVEVVLDHAIGSFAKPVLAGKLCSSWGTDGPGSRHDAVSLLK